MEDDVGTLEQALSNLETETQEEKSDFEGLYKNWGKTGSQEERRAELLEIQKVNRNTKIDRFRGILELVNAVEDSDNKLFQSYKKAPYRPNIYVAGFHKASPTYNNVLMLSEWIIEKPSDFEENWFVVPCPKGVRVLVIANNGITKFYTKFGHFKFECHTSLPGGNPHMIYRKNCCVLDCFYNEKSNTLYLLDLLAWNNQPMTDGETEFRHYWMKTQLEDFPDTKTVNKKNKVIIKILSMMPCTTHYLSYMLSTYPMFENNDPPLDGLLFYHKRAHYVAGETPLVGWLFPYMIPEVLGEEITMHPGYLAEKPDGYVNQADFIKMFEEKLARKNKRRTSSSMETDTTKDKQISESDEKNNGNEVKGTDNKNAEEAIETVKSIDMENTDETNESKSMETDSSKEEKKNEEKETKTMETDDKEEQNSTESKKNINKNKSESKSHQNAFMDAFEVQLDANNS